MTDDYREAMDAVLEALDIPHPATAGDVPMYRHVLEGRVSQVRIMLHAILAAGNTDIAWEVTYLRKRLTELPPTGYRHVGQSA